MKSVREIPSTVEVIDAKGRVVENRPSSWKEGRPLDGAAGGREACRAPWNR